MQMAQGECWNYGIGDGGKMAFKGIGKGKGINGYGSQEQGYVNYGGDFGGERGGDCGYQMKGDGGEKGYGDDMKGKGSGKKGMNESQMIEMMQTMMMMGKNRAMGGVCAPAPNRPAVQLALCTVHGKKRNIAYLEDDSFGGLRCIESSECHTGANIDGSAAVSGTLPCSVHGKTRSFMSLEDDGMGGLRCKPGMQCQVGPRGQPQQIMVCSVHGKKRTMAALEDDSLGGLRCKDGQECQMSSKGSGESKGGGPVAQVFCTIHGKPRSIQSLEPFMGGYKCKEGFTCKGFARPTPY